MDTDPKNVADALGRWMRCPKQRREYVLMHLADIIKGTGDLAREADARRLTALADNYRENLATVEMACDVLSFAPPDVPEDDTP